MSLGSNDDWLSAGGVSNPTKHVNPTGNQAIDGILTEDAWAGTGIEYSFPTSASIYGYEIDTDITDNFFALNTAQQNAARFALDANEGINIAAKAGFSVEGFTNLTITRDATPDTEQIRLANTFSAEVPTAQVADFPGNYVSDQPQDNGDVWFGTDEDYSAPAAGNYAWHTTLHEIGHALGLKHAHEDDWSYGAVPSDFDSMEYSVMSYRSYVDASLDGPYTNEYWGYAQSYMMLDIAALQQMYGADFTTNSGNTIYSWSPTSGATLVNGVAAISPGANRIFATIWDGGGNDTYDLSKYTTNLKIDLAPGSFSLFSSSQQANLGDGHYARGNIFNALQYHGDARSLIENAIGGSGNDAISGNAAINTLTGNAGNDALHGLTGNDVLRGGAGNDSLYGDQGADTMYGDAGNDTFYIDNVLDKAIETTAGTAGGFDIVYSTVSFTLGANVESLRMVPGSGNVNGTGNDLGNELWGTSATNTLRGLGGADSFDSGSGADILIGGLGNDTFKFALPQTSDQTARDRLIAGDGAVAFEKPGAVLGDRFDLSKMDANTSLAGQQHLVFATGPGAGKVWAVDGPGGDTLIRANVDGDAAVEFEVAIADGSVGHGAYGASDFIL